MFVDEVLEELVVTFAPIFDELSGFVYFGGSELESVGYIFSDCRKEKGCKVRQVRVVDVVELVQNLDIN